MLSLILAIVLGIAFTFVAIQNPTIVPVRFFDLALNLPLYIFGALTFLGGLAIAALFSLFDTAGTAFDLHKRDSQINALSKDTQNLQYHIQKLTNENQELRSELHQTRSQVRSEQFENTKERIKNFFRPARHTHI